MKLIEIEIRNFRSLRGQGNVIKVDTPNIIFLLGQNNVGKSSVLDAYQYLVTPKKKALISDFCGFKPIEPIEIFATFKVEAADREEFEKKGLDKWADERGFVRFKRRWERPDAEGQRYTFDPAENKYVPGGFKGLDTHFAKHAPVPIPIHAMPTSAELEKWVSGVVKQLVLSQLSEEDLDAYEAAAQKLQELKERAASGEKIEEINTAANKHFKKVFPDLSLEINPKEDDPQDIEKLLEKNFTVTVEDPRLDSSLPIETQGHGVIRQAIFNMLGLLADYAKKRSSDSGSKKYLLLFEEPELYLHPAKVRLLRDALYSIGEQSSFQVICASHSSSLIDLTKPHVSLVRMTKSESGEVRMLQAGDDVFSGPKDRRNQVLMANRFNPFVCETFFADEVVLVEGDTEAIVFRELFAKLAPARDIHVLNVGSKNNIPFFQDVLSHFEIRHHIIHDADHKYVFDKEGQVQKNKDGSLTKNSSWTLGKTIWDKLQGAYKLGRRYVFVPDFEGAHEYTPNSNHGKPYSAYLFAANLTGEGSSPAESFARQILGLEQYPEHEFSSEHLASLISEP